MLGRNRGGCSGALRQLGRLFPFGRKDTTASSGETRPSQPVHLDAQNRPSSRGHGHPGGPPSPEMRQPAAPAPIPLRPEQVANVGHAYTDAVPTTKGLTRAAPADGLLTAVDLKKAYKGKEVVRGASVHVARGEAVGLLGPNGAGKTTMFYMITGLVHADSGHIHIDGHDVTSLPMYQRSRLGISYLPQEASIFRGLTVEQNIMAVLEVVERSRKKRKERLERLLEEFRITHKRSTIAMRLSGGERRRCEIARALASDPSYVLLDEPFAGVDPVSTQDIQNLVSQLTNLNIGVLITDHNVRETLEMTDRAYVVHQGQILTHGNRLDIINDEETKRVYLGDMYAQR